MNNNLARAALFGIAAGFVANVVMDIFVALILPLMGSPAAFMFEFIGTVALRLFAGAGASGAGAFPLGLLIHYLFGLGFGGVFCAILVWAPRLEPATLGKAILLGVAYIEIFSQPFVASAPLILRTAASDTILWYALSTVMHGIYGAVLGALVHYRRPILARLPSRAAA